MGKTGRGDEKDMGGIRNIHLSLAFISCRALSRHFHFRGSGGEYGPSQTVPEGQAHGVVMRRAAT